MIPIEINDLLLMIRREPNLLVGSCTSNGALGANYPACSLHCEPSVGMRGIVLFPFEYQFIKKLLVDEEVEFLHKVIPIAQGEICPYLKNKQCLLGNSRPISCRMWPIAIQKLGSRNLELLAMLECPSARDPLNSTKLQIHLDHWVGYFVAYWKYLTPTWWKLYNTSYELQRYHSLGQIEFELPGDIVSPDMAKLAFPRCHLCKGQGFVTINQRQVLCECVRNQLKILGYDPTRLS